MFNMLHFQFKKFSTSLNFFHFFSPQSCLTLKNLPASEGDTGSISGWGRSLVVGNGNPLEYSCLLSSLYSLHQASLVSQRVSACSAGDPGSIPWLGRSPGGGNGNPLQYSCLKNPMDRGTWWATVHGVAKSRMRLSDFTLTYTYFT